MTALVDFNARVLMSRWIGIGQMARVPAWLLLSLGSRQRFL